MVASEKDRLLEGWMRRALPLLLFFLSLITTLLVVVLALSFFQKVQIPSGFSWVLRTIVGMASLSFFTGLLITSALCFWRHRDDPSISAIEEERRQVLDLATHEIGTPLSTFRWWLDLLRDSSTADTIDREDLMEQVAIGVEQLDGVLKSLNTAKEVNLRALSYEGEVVKSLKGIVFSVLQEATSDLKLRGIKARTDIEEGGRAIRVDGKQVKDVLRELLANAMTFSPPGSMLLITVRTHHDHCEVSVEDRGYGVPKKDLPHVFEKFYRGSNATKYRANGSGMGLYNAKGVIERCGGTMWMKSKEGRGTEVGFTLPLA